jgi:Uma2 family endonuclease
MARHIEDEVVYYYDLYPTEEDLMGETFLHRMLVQYLMDLLLWLFHGQHCAIYANLNFYQTPEYKEEPLAPDLAVIKGIDVQEVTSWRVGKTGPAPQVVFEIASAKTWKNDIDEKPSQYARMGVQEYFAYDPNTPLLDRQASSRLRGWRLDAARREMQEMSLRPDGTLWSMQLDSLLVPDGPYLSLYDRLGRLRLTQAQAEAERADAEAEARKVEAGRAEAEKRRADLAERRARAEAKRAEALAEKLRSLGIDPDQL